MTVKKIFLDFYNNNIICFNAKQNDEQSRTVEITCTSHGQKEYLDPSRMSAIIAYKNAKNEDLVDGAIKSDGTIELVLTKEMLSVPGKMELEVIIVAQHAITVSKFEGIEDFRENISSVLSTMKFYINVIDTTVSYPDVETADDYRYLVRTLMKLNSLESELRNLKNSIEETLGNPDNGDIIGGISSAVTVANEASTKANEAYTKADSAMKTAESAKASCNQLMENADGRFIESSEKGVNGGVAELNSSGKIPTSQLPYQVANNLTTSDGGYVLDARQGAKLVESINNKQNIIEGAAKHAATTMFNKNVIVISDNDGYIAPSQVNVDYLKYLQCLNGLDTNKTVAQMLSEINGHIGQTNTNLSNLSDQYNAHAAKYEGHNHASDIVTETLTASKEGYVSFENNSTYFTTKQVTYYYNKITGRLEIYGYSILNSATSDSWWAPVVQLQGQFIPTIHSPLNVTRFHVPTNDNGVNRILNGIVYGIQKADGGADAGDCIAYCNDGCKAGIGMYFNCNFYIEKGLDIPVTQAIDEHTE